MLRPKQLGTLAQSARSIYINGSRWSTVDGAAYSSSEDEPSISKRQSTAPNIQNTNAFPALTKPAYAEKIRGPSGGNSPMFLLPASSPQISSSVSGNQGRQPHVVQAARGDSLPSSSRTRKGTATSRTATSAVLSSIVGGKAEEPSRTPVEVSQQQQSYSSSASSRHRSKAPEGQPPRPPFRGSKTGTEMQGSGYTKPTPSLSGSQAHSAQQRSGFHSDSCSEARTGDVARPTIVQPLGNLRSPKGAKKASNNRGSGTMKSLSSVRAVEQYYNTLQQMKWGPASEQVLNSLNYKLDPFQANQVLKLLRDHSVALGFFQWLKRQPGFRHDGHTYTTMIGILGQARQFSVMRKLFEEMNELGCKPTVVTYNRLIHAYGRANYITEALGAFGEMQAAGHQPDRVTFCTLIDIHAKAGYFDGAMDLYSKMQDVGLMPDTFTYSVMVNCLGKGGHLAAAYKLFCEMIDNGCVPNLVTYNTMITLQAKSRNYENVVKLYKDMQASGFCPDKITYSIVMEFLGHCGHLDEAEAVFLQMRRDWVPDEPVYGLLVDMWGKAGNVEKAQAWFRTMLEDGLQPNVPTSNSLLSAFLRMRRFGEAYNFLQSMLGSGLIPSLQTYTLLLSSCTEARADMDLCGELMAITGHPAHMFLLCLPDAEPGGQNVREHAGCFLDMMHSEDRESKRGLMDAVIDFLHKSGLKEEAGFIWEAAAQRNVYPDSVKEKDSSYWLINLHLMSEGTAVTALSRTLAWFQRQMLCCGAGPRRIDIVTGWGRRSRVTGSSLVRQSVQRLLDVFGFPFSPSPQGNSGCFVGAGDPLSRWLLNPYIERMHLL